MPMTTIILEYKVQVLTELPLTHQYYRPLLCDL